MAIDDIPGSKPKIVKKLQTRDSYTCNDIDGAKPKIPFARKTVHDQTYNDVTAPKKMVREVPHNPSNPSYKIRDDDGNLIEIGNIPGSSPTKKYFRKKPED
jgi:hypothetical protein